MSLQKIIMLLYNSLSKAKKNLKRIYLGKLSIVSATW